MINLAERSLQKELLDADNIPFSDIQQNMKELNLVNTRLGGHNITISAVKTLLAQRKSETPTICEIGCGGGDNLAAIAKWCRKNEIKARFIGVDIKEECIAFSHQQYPEIPASWIVSDFRRVTFPEKPAIIFSSLFCHHFKDDEIVSMLQWMKQNCTEGFFINDLHRHPLAYQFIKKMTALLSKSYLVKNDAPLSVARGFKKLEWKALFSRAGLDNYSIEWKWAFRYLIICPQYGPK